MTQAFSKARVSLGPTGYGTVEVEGHDISRAVKAVTVIGKPDHVPVLRLDLNLMGSLDVDADVQAELPEWIVQALIGLGWTPPATPTAGEGAQETPPQTA